MRTLILLGFVLSSFVMRAQDSTAMSADAVMKKAYTQAAKENKKVLVAFHASWCGWCRAMEASLNDSSVKAYFQKNFVITWLTVLETPEKKNLENPGAEEFLNQLDGKDRGLPYWAILDNKGQMLANAQYKPGENTGCPASDTEVDYWISVLQKHTKMSKAEADAVRKRFRKNDTE